MSETEALAQLDQARKDGKLLDVEVSELRKQILDSRLTSKVISVIMEALAGEMSHTDDVRFASRHLAMNEANPN